MSYHETVIIAKTKARFSIFREAMQVSISIEWTFTHCDMIKKSLAIKVSSGLIDKNVPNLQRLHQFPAGEQVAVFVKR